jgi:hypothetical protein
MKTSVQTFIAGVDELLVFLANTEHETQLIGLLLDEARQAVLLEEERLLLSRMAEARTDRKRYIYSVAIVALYGLVERLVDSLVSAFVQRVSGLVDSYEAMPEAIRRNHVPLSLDLIKAIMEERHHQEDMTRDEVIANLHSCLSGAASFRVNGAAFVLHRGNLTLAKIAKILTSVGVEFHNRRVSLAPTLGGFFREREPERKVEKVADQDLPALLEAIDNLVERRNEVSHGVISVDAIESVDLLKNRCRFVAAYGTSLYEVLVQEVLRYEVLRPAAQPLGKPIAVYNNSIVCFDSSKCEIAIDSLLVAATEDSFEPFRHGPVASLQINKKDYSTLSISVPTRFGARVLYRASEKFEYYVLPRDAI